MQKVRVKRHEVIQPLDTSYRLIPLTQSKNAIVDSDDFEWLNQFNWCALKSRCTYYAVKRHSVAMHRMIMKCSPEEEVDHRNFNGLDNRKENLRKCTHQQNKCNGRLESRNTSGFRGISFDERGKWRAMIKVKGKPHWLGRFTTPEEAARAYDCAAKIHHGQFASLNFPNE